MFQLVWGGGRGGYPYPFLRSADVVVLSTEQPFERRQTNKRLQDLEERGATWQRCAPPTRALHYCDGCVASTPVTALCQNMHIRQDTRSGADRPGCVSRSKGYLPDNTDSGKRGHGSRIGASQRVKHGFVIFGVTVSCVHRFVLPSVSLLHARVSPSVRAV